ncbi:MAG: hypothetical protein AAGD33_15965 [Actinomycetota bacterium]
MSRSDPIDVLGLAIAQTEATTTMTDEERERVAASMRAAYRATLGSPVDVAESRTGALEIDPAPSPEPVGRRGRPRGRASLALLATAAVALGVVGVLALVGGRDGTTDRAPASPTELDELPQLSLDPISDDGTTRRWRLDLGDESIEFATTARAVVRQDGPDGFSIVLEPGVEAPGTDVRVTRTPAFDQRPPSDWFDETGVTATAIRSEPGVSVWQVRIPSSVVTELGCAPLSPCVEITDPGGDGPRVALRSDVTSEVHIIESDETLVVVTDRLGSTVGSAGLPIEVERDLFLETLERI